MSPQLLKILGVPIDLGGNHRGVDMGPSALRVAGLNAGLRSLGHEVRDLGNVSVPNPQSRDPGNPTARFLDEIGGVCSEVATTVHREMGDGAGLVVLGGDHSAAIGSISGTSARAAERGESIGVIWVDAHTDMNTPETSPSGNIHGMPVACLIGRGPDKLTGILGPSPKVKPENVVFVGIRSVDPTERDLVHGSGCHVFTMREVDELGIRRVMTTAMELACADTAGFHLSFDMDGVDCRVAPGVGTPVMGGLTYRESHLLCEMAHDSEQMIAMDLMEVNPVEDVRNATAELGVELILSAHGKKIL
ncbi:MAG: arginase [Planctomycetota bacterium]|nr:arginase [Planctomycetota bacterium]